MTATSDIQASAEAREISHGLVGAIVAVSAWSTGTILAKYIDMGGLAIGFYRFAFFASAIAVTRLSAPGPLVAMHTPGLPVVRA